MWNYRTALTILAVALSVNAGNAFAKAVIEEESFVQDTTHQFLGLLKLNRNLTIDHVSREGYEVYGPKGTRATVLAKLGAPVLDIKSYDKDLADHPTFVQYEAAIRAIVAKYPDIMRLSSIGQSVQGKALYMVKISDNPDMDEVEPEAKYISSMHGDEITGREVLLSWLDEIGTRYNAGDAEIVNFVNNTELFIMPSMNPDGSDMRQRGNGNYADLNRDFPDFTSDNNNSPSGREPETQAVMAFQASRNIALSANFHGGSEVVNYPWDTTSARHPFDRLCQDLSRGYADMVSYLRDSREFEHGITNGYDWYEVDGGMQDWSYHWYNDLQVTIEISGTKYPAYSEMPRFYEENRGALLHYLSSVHRGAGFALDVAGLSGSVRIYALGANDAQTDLGNYDFSHSEFYKVLEDGRYRFVIDTKQDGDRASAHLEFTTTVATGAFATNGNYTHLTL